MRGASESLPIPEEEGPKLILHPGTRIRILQEEDQLQVFVETGGIDAVSNLRSVKEVGYQTAFLTVKGTQAELRLLAFPESSWVALKSGTADVSKRANGETASISWGEYAVVDPNGPLQFVNSALTCPKWRFRSQLVAGDLYPDNQLHQP